jgi:hypothetical protein
MIRRIDPIGRTAFGGLCIAGAAAVAAPVLLVVGAVGGVVFVTNGDVVYAIAYWLLAWAMAVFSAGLAVGIFFTAFPLSSDWITEWPGYAVALALGAATVALMALLLFPVPAPIYVAVIVPLLLCFGGGFGVAGRLAGLKAPSARPRRRLARRR